MMLFVLRRGRRSAIMVVDLCFHTISLSVQFTKTRGAQRKAVTSGAREEKTFRPAIVDLLHICLRRSK